MKGVSGKALILSRNHLVQLLITPSPHTFKLELMFDHVNWEGGVGDVDIQVPAEWLLLSLGEEPEGFLCQKPQD